MRLRFTGNDKAFKQKGVGSGQLHAYQRRVLCERPCGNGKYNGQLMLRIRPDDTSIIETSIDRPYEVHLVAFETESDFHDFMKDEERKQFLHLKEQAIKAVVLIKGEKI